MFRFTGLLGLFCSVCLLAFAPIATAKMPLQLASTYSKHITPEHYFVSEKLDGIRARWTGSMLLTRSGNPIHAPAWFTKHWPAVPLDGELWTKRADFQRIASIVLSDTPDERWRNVKFMLFDLPTHGGPFIDRVDAMARLIANTNNGHLAVIEQLTFRNHHELQAHLKAVTDAGGEGLMLHHKQALYADGRSPHLLKVKLFDDAEARVIAHVPGKGKYAGMMGSLLVETASNVQFKIGTGFSDDDRLHPPPVGSWVTYKYYGTTNTGKPRFASFLRRIPKSDLQ
ncbi:DNA ligase [Aestuariibacter sp. A3R04]|uniref:DNA ligase n=1 Tax=Aestuariibacter sp. A3R04 TaxID=2841571 RepID=UPI001C09219D|nr:DNA ligase [Aestuariibacter sp. A3R04]MBU3023818.1 DNA ligase [Aestuariibacter sp. A3R04]